MKQRISVRAIIQQDGKTLILRRANGRASILGKYELPGGKIGYGEQPEDALRRYLYDDAKLHIKSAQLYDAVTYIDHDDRDIQYAVVVYTVSLVAEERPIMLSGNYDKYAWHQLSKSHHDDATDLTQLLMGIVAQDVITEDAIRGEQVFDVIKTSDTSITVFSDGGSRGNPGPSAAGFVVVDSSQNVIAEGGQFLGVTTSDHAEYHGVYLGMQKAAEMGYKRINFKIDSMMVVNQMNGRYKIKNRALWPIHQHIRDLMKQFEAVSFSHVGREFNRLADGMVNKTLDQHEAQHDHSHRHR